MKCVNLKVREVTRMRRTRARVRAPSMVSAGLIVEESAIAEIVSAVVQWAKSTQASIGVYIRWDTEDRSKTVELRSN